LEEKDIVDKLNKAKGANFVQAKTSTEDKGKESEEVSVMMTVHKRIKHNTGPDLKNQSQQYWTAEQKREAERKAALQQRVQQNDQSLLQARDAEAQKISQQAKREYVFSFFFFVSSVHVHLKPYHASPLCLVVQTLSSILCFVYSKKKKKNY